MEKTFEKRRFAPDAISEKDKQSLAELREHYFHELSRNAIESEGFLHIPKENIGIFPPGTMRNADGTVLNPVNGVLQIREPAEKKGIEEFAQRDAFEKEHLRTMKNTRAYVAKENDMWRGVQLPTQAFHPEIGGRFCFHVVKIFENREGQFLFLPILPDTGQLYSGHVKIGGSNLLRGNNALKGSNLFKGAFHKEKVSSVTEQSGVVQKDIHFTPCQTGMWDIQFVNHKNKTSTIHGCHVARDENTGTLDVFQSQKTVLLDDPKDVRVTNAAVDWVYALAKLEDLRTASPDESLPVGQLYLGQELVEDITQLPEKYQGIFRKEDDGWCIDHYQPVPTLQKFLDYEKQIIDIPQEKHVRNQAEIAGKMFEKVIGKIPGVHDVPRKEQRTIPWNDDVFRDLLAKECKEFQDWAQHNEATMKAVTFDPDYVLDDGTYVELKRSRVNYNQLFKTRLFQLIEALHGVDVKVRYVSLDRTSSDEKLLEQLGMEIESFFDSEWAQNVSPSDPDMQRLIFLHGRIDELRQKLAKEQK